MESLTKSNLINDKVESREENIKLAQMAEQTGNYEDMYEFIQQIIKKSNFNFSAEERLLFATSFKQKVSVIQLRIEKITNWEKFYVWQDEDLEHLSHALGTPAFLRSTLTRIRERARPASQAVDTAGNEEQGADQYSRRSRLTPELLEICHQMIKCLTEKLIRPNTTRTNEHLIYYTKMQADYQRYLIGFLEFYKHRPNFEQEFESNPAFAESGANPRIRLFRLGQHHRGHRAVVLEDPQRRESDSGKKQQAAQRAHFEHRDFLLRHRQKRAEGLQPAE